ncbi:Malto-oligosyltrehalose trehalohydrolase [Ensifer adhaerens]|uniref:malto-oligosyltrehalose trehalohydrolase n=1 Tax=Ensifer adhaerens TaxID=106592 RepID=UPI001569F1B3|nr:malto-oligosyltrehalose trehalohydrolase [Ensifer adhaerens]NRP21862.1 Malto-oligosyltrehalose trehalohydrolase [Ensifer adhaerens]
MLIQKVEDNLSPVWGTSITSPPGKTLFRIWAPDEQRVGLALCGQELEMSHAGDGWFSLHCDVQAGAEYQFVLADGTMVADPASHAQVGSLEGPSLLVDHSIYQWKHDDWRGRPWTDAIISEIHVGTFSPEGTFLAAIPRLAELAEIGISAIQLMPVGHFPGDRGWGYDGVLHFAPHNAYGTPDDLKALVDAAHGLGMMVILDVVYNHFGARGNKLSRYASAFFNGDRDTPWGAGIDFDRPEVRRYFLDNACHWLGRFRIDGLRFDAVEHITDTGKPPFLEHLAVSLRESFPDRKLHLIVEDAERRPRLVAHDEDRPLLFSAGWNDDFHHALHVLLTHEHHGHYKPFAAEPTEVLKEVLATGFNSRTSTGKKARVPLYARVSFLQNHDQVGNRLLGDRLVSLIGQDKMDVLTSLLLLTPHIPLLFMGDEYGETSPFHFFADYGGEMATSIRMERPQEARNFGNVPRDLKIEDLPDPIGRETFLSSKLDWQKAESASGRRTRKLIRELTHLRFKHVVPLLPMGPPLVQVAATRAGIIAVDWQFGDDCLQLRANFSEMPCNATPVSGSTIWRCGGKFHGPEMPPMSLLIAVDSKSPRSDR